MKAKDALRQIELQYLTDKTALFIETYNSAGNMRTAAKLLGISAATLCLFFKQNRIKIGPRKAVAQAGQKRKTEREQ